MNTTAGGLKKLHQLHIKLRQVHEQLERGPKQLNARRQLVDRKQAELDAQKERLTQLRKTVDQKSLQLKSNESKIADLRVKLNSASSNREFDIIKGQIEADTMANSVLEDEILEVLGNIDEMQLAIKKLEEEVAASEEQAKRVAEEIAAAEPGLKQNGEELEAAIQAAESTLPNHIREKYRRLVQAHGANALAAVENSACTICYVGLSPQSRVELNSGNAIFCKSCGRLLYPGDEQ